MLIAISACGPRLRLAGRVTTEMRPVADVTQVHVSNSGLLTIIQDETESLQIETDEALMPYVLSEMRDGKLSLSIQLNGWVSGDSRVRYVLHVKSLQSIEAANSSQVNAERMFAKSLDTRAANSAEINIQRVEAETLNIAVSNSSSVRLAGSTVTQTVSASGSSNYYGRSLLAKTSTVTAQNSSEIETTSATAVTGSASNSSRVLDVGAGTGHVQTSNSAMFSRR